MPEPLEPRDILSRYRFLLGAFGLQQVKVAIYRPGKPIDAKENDSSFTTEHQDKGEANMHTGYVPGEYLQPVKANVQATSSLGTPVFSDVVLHKQDTPEESGIQLLYCLVTVEQSRNIVKTAIQGRNGTVKEYISDGDFVVNLKGAIVNTFKSNYPSTEVKRFIELLKEQRALKVVSPYLLQFGIYEIVVDSYSFPQEQGKQNMQKFEIRCSSDDPNLLKDIKDGYLNA